MCGNLAHTCKEGKEGRGNVDLRRQGGSGRDKNGHLEVSDGDWEDCGDQVVNMGGGGGDTQGDLHGVTTSYEAVHGLCPCSPSTEAPAVAVVVVVVNSHPSVV